VKKYFGKKVKKKKKSINFESEEVITKEKEEASEK